MGTPFLSTPLPASFLDPAIDPVPDSSLDPSLDSPPTLPSTQSSTLSPTLPSTLPSTLPRLSPYHTSSVICSEPQLTQRAFLPASRVTEYRPPTKGFAIQVQISMKRFPGFSSRTVLD